MTSRPSSIVTLDRLRTAVTRNRSAANRAGVPGTERDRNDVARSRAVHAAR